MRSLRTSTKTQHSPPPKKGLTIIQRQREIITLETYLIDSSTDGCGQDCLFPTKDLQVYACNGSKHQESHFSSAGENWDRAGYLGQSVLSQSGEERCLLGRVPCTKLRCLLFSFANQYNPWESIAMDRGSSSIFVSVLPNVSPRELAWKNP